ncbi:hypothetical protein GCM10010136_03990 [Limoniibacter endophyticus]|uniref:Uncharacterized protein n=1 Tax=Limoniibacter endophyticus TaxID=1565040 RepID=A0A8J3DFX2_9HYPH|nr:hypothetical protein GCM10010136_03990 [Limoniibacter endophyticus]
MIEFLFKPPSIFAIISGAACGSGRISGSIAGTGNLLDLIVFAALTLIGGRFPPFGWQVQPGRLEERER